MIPKKRNTQESVTIECNDIIKTTKNYSTLQFYDLHYRIIPFNRLARWSLFDVDYL